MGRGRLGIEIDLLGRLLSHFSMIPLALCLAYTQSERDKPILAWLSCIQLAAM
jgi:hypothetical protein